MGFRGLLQDWKSLRVPSRSVAGFEGLGFEDFGFLVLGVLEVEGFDCGVSDQT